MSVIAVHDRSVTSVEELDQKLRRSRASVWAGRDLPFTVAIDGLRRDVGPTTDRGATSATYGIEARPTTVLIGKQSKVVGCQTSTLALEPTPS